MGNAVKRPGGGGVFYRQGFTACTQVGVSFRGCGDVGLGDVIGPSACQCSVLGGVALGPMVGTRARWRGVVRRNAVSRGGGGLRGGRCSVLGCVGVAVRGGGVEVLGVLVFGVLGKLGVLGVGVVVV